MNIIKTKLSAGQQCFIAKDKAPFEDKIQTVETSSDENGTDVTYKLLESGELSESDVFATKREVLVKLGYVDVITRKRKEVEPK